MEHIIKECEKTKEGITIEEVLKEDGSGKDVMYRIERARKRREEERKTEMKEGETGGEKDKEELEERKGERPEGEECNKQCNIL